MPPRGRKDPSLIAPMGDQGPEIEVSIDEAEQSSEEPGQEGPEQPTLMYPGELLQTSMTLAVVLPGDQKESYFGARFVGRAQEWESDQELTARAITVTRDAVLGQIDDAVDAIDVYRQQLQARLQGRQQ